jgi:hypothetical protein
VIDVLTDLFIPRGPPAFVRSDNGPEFVAESVQRWLTAVGARTAFIEPGSPWENGYIESFNARLRDELLDGEIFYALKEAQVLIEQSRQHYNAIRPHSRLGYRPPAPEAIVPPNWPSGSAPLRRPSSLAEQPTMHQHSTWTSHWGRINQDLRYRETILLVVVEYDDGSAVLVSESLQVPS